MRALLALILTGCVATVQARPPVPPCLDVSYRTYWCERDYIWVPGYWAFGFGGWFWVPGHYGHRRR